MQMNQNLPPGQAPDVANNNQVDDRGSDEGSTDEGMLSQPNDVGFGSSPQAVDSQN
jgi:hypothetical protein